MDPSIDFSTPIVCSKGVTGHYPVLRLQTTLWLVLLFGITCFAEWSKSKQWPCSSSPLHFFCLRPFNSPCCIISINSTTAAFMSLKGHLTKWNDYCTFSIPLINYMESDELCVCKRVWFSSSKCRSPSSLNIICQKCACSTQRNGPVAANANQHA